MNVIEICFIKLKIYKELIQSIKMKWSKDEYALDVGFWKKLITFSTIINSHENPV